MAKKNITQLTAAETIKELKKSPEESRQTSYTRSALFVHLGCLLFKAYCDGDNVIKEIITDYLDFIIINGSESDKNRVVVLKQSLSL